MASELAIYYTPMHFMWGVKSGATPVKPAKYLYLLQCGIFSFCAYYGRYFNICN